MKKGEKIAVFGLLTLIMVMSLGIPVAGFQSSPANGAIDVPVDGSIVLEFNETMIIGTVMVDLTPDPVYPMEKVWTNNDRTLTITPVVSLLNERSYTVHVTGEAMSGNHTDQTFAFSTEAAPTIMETLSDFFSGMYDAIVGSLFGIAIFIIILVIGYVVAWVVKKAVHKGLEKSPFDRAMQTMGVEKDVQKLGIKSVSALIATLLFWFIFVIFMQIALDYAGIDTLTATLTPIVLFIPRILVAVIIILVGLYFADLAVIKIKDILAKGPFGEKIKKMDREAEKTGFTISSFMFIFVKVFILLIFIQVALSILAVNILSTFITPILLLMPLILAALVIVVIGLIVAEYVVKILIGFLKEMEFEKLVDPVEAMVKRQGLIMKMLSWVVQVLVILIFVQIAVGVLNSTGAFNMLAQLINAVILWIPSLIMGLLIGLIGFWVASWVHDKVLVWGKDLDVPFLSMLAKIIQFTIIYIAVTMALDQAGVEVPMLYLIFGIAVGAVFIGVAVGFAYGSKDIFHNVISYLQTSQTLKAGQRVKIEEFDGTIESIGRYHLTLRTTTGKVRIPHSKISKAIIVEKD